MYALRQIVSIVALPFTVAVIVPVWLARARHLSFATPAGASGWLAAAAAAAVFAIGGALFAASVALFWRHGRGTLAPWDPPRRLVIDGPYRYVRNPMISGLVFVLFAEALAMRSRAHLVWALLFLGANFVYIPLLEEPMLADRFGNAYREYARHVPRIVPRLRPWGGG